MPSRNRGSLIHKRRNRPWLWLLLVVVGLAASIAAMASSAPSAPRTTLVCYGTERWPIKTLADPAASQVNLTPISKTVTQLWAFSPPSAFDTGIRNPGAEMKTYKVTARLVRSRWVDDPPPAPGKHGGDLDIHLVIAPATDVTGKHTMVVEFPLPLCVQATTALKKRMARAREAFLRDCGLPGRHFRDLTGTAKITGVGFFDRPHASGAAKNGFELHPVIRFSSADCQQP
jgi:hypothetical protein